MKNGKLVLGLVLSIMVLFGSFAWLCTFVGKVATDIIILPVLFMGIGAAATGIFLGLLLRRQDV